MLVYLVFWEFFNIVLCNNMYNNIIYYKYNNLHLLAFLFAHVEFNEYQVCKKNNI